MWLFVSAVSGFVAVAAGAFGAHGLRDHLPPADLATFDLAARYQLLHAVALVATDLSRRVLPPPAWPIARLAAWAFLLGTVFFCGSLYALALSGVRWFGAITPIGGVGFLLGWGALAVAGWRAADRRPA